MEVDTSECAENTDIDRKPVGLDMISASTVKEPTPCFLCEQKDDFPECIRLAADQLPAFNENENSDKDLDVLRKFKLKVLLVTPMCKGCRLHLRLLSEKRADTKDPVFCHSQCAWLRVIAGLSPIESETVSDIKIEKNEKSDDPKDELVCTFDRIKTRLHHQALVELTSKALPENLLPPPIKSYDEMSNFFKSRINLSPAKGTDLISPVLPKKRGRPKKNLNAKKEEVLPTTPVERMSRETSRLKGLDCSYLEIIFRHPEGYSPHSILMTPDRSLDRSSVRKSVSFSNNDSYFERYVYDDSDDSDDSNKSRDCSRSPGSPVLKRRKIEHEAHPNKLSPKKNPPNSPSKIQKPLSTSTPTRTSDKNGIHTSDIASLSKTKKKHAKNERSLIQKEGKQSTNAEDPKQKNKHKKLNKNAHTKTIIPAVGFIKLKLAPLLHGKKKHDLVKSPPKRLQTGYLQKKFGVRLFSCRVNISRKAFNALLVVHEIAEGGYEDSFSSDGKAVSDKNILLQNSATNTQNTKSTGTSSPVRDLISIQLNDDGSNSKIQMDKITVEGLSINGKSPALHDRVNGELSASPIEISD